MKTRLYCSAKWMKITARYRFKHRIYHTSSLKVFFRERFQLSLNIQSDTALLGLAVVAVSSVGWGVGSFRYAACVGRAEFESGTDRTFFLFVIWPMFILFFPPYNLSFFGDDLIFTLCFFRGRAPPWEVKGHKCAPWWWQGTAPF
jgi:hypothetical protein